MQAYLIAFERTDRELAAKGQDGGAISAELLQQLPKRSLAEWMVGYNVKSRYLKTK